MPRKRVWIAYLVGIAVWGAQQAISLTAPLTLQAAEWGFTRFTLRLVQVSIALPGLLTLLLLAHAWSRVKRYSLLTGSKDGWAFGRIARGIVLLYAGMVLSMFLRIFHSDGFGDAWQAPATVIGNFVQAWVPLAAFYFIYLGAKALLDQIGESAYAKRLRPRVAAAVAAIGAVYAYVIFTNPNRQASADPLIQPSYFIPDALIVLLLIIPIVAGWFYAIMSAMAIRRFAQKVPGIIYKQALNPWVVGMLLVIATSVAGQFLVGLGGSRLLGTGIVAILAIVYALVFVQLAGYLLIAKGAKKLSKIEEITQPKQV